MNRQCLAMILIAAFAFVSEAGADGIQNYSRPTKPAAAPVAVSGEPQLFIDDYLIAESSNLVRTTHSPTRAMDHPILGWQAGTTTPYLTVLHDREAKQFRMWYNRDGRPNGSIAYAESEDGINWKLPKLGVLGDDNRVLQISNDFQAAYGVSVIDDGRDAPDPQHRFKMAWWAQAKPWPNGDPGMRVAFSPDGIHWTPFAGNPVLADFGDVRFVDDSRRPYGASDIIDVFRDPYRQRYMAMVKTPAVPSDGYAPGPKAAEYIRRLVSASASDDFVHWERPWRVVVPEAREEGLLEFYGVGGTFARGGLLIGFVRMLRDDLPATEGGPAEGIGYTTLVTSRDGEHWQRHDDVFFDRHPDPAAWDHAMAWIGSVVSVGDELYLYYGGYKQGHKIEPSRERQIGIARMPCDRFVSRDAADDRDGVLKTVAIQLPADVAAPRLVLNADCADGGEIRVQLCDARTGAVVPGFGWDDCQPIDGDGHRLAVAWTDVASLPSDATPAELRLVFQLKDVALYGFQIMPSAAVKK